MSRALRGLVALTITFTLLVADQLRAAPPAASLSGLRSDTVFYASWLRSGEQVQRLLKSNFTKKVQELPALKTGLKQAMDYWENPTDLMGAFVKATLDLPENRELQDMLRDGVENEFFVSGGPDWLKVLDLMNKINVAQRAGQLEQLKNLKPGEADPEKLQEQNKERSKQVLKILLQNPDLLVVPDTLIGFRLSDNERAGRQLGRLERFLRQSLQGQPELAARLKKEQIGGRPFLVLRLDGEQLPLDDLKEALEREDSPIEEADRPKVMELVRKTKLTISLGVTGKFLLLHIGSSTKPLETLSQGPRLADRPEMAPLLKQGDKPFTQVGFTSPELAGTGSQGAATLRAMTDALGDALEKADLPADIRADLAKDIRALVEKAASEEPAKGGSLGFTYMTPRGYESMVYAEGQGAAMDSSKPLSILQHVGGNPIYFSAGRAKGVGEGYEVLRMFAEKGLSYFERIAAVKFEQKDKDELARLKADIGPLLTRFDKATRELLLPGLKDGQAAVILDAKMLSPRWHPAMPAANRPLPLPELAYVVGVSDKALVRKAAVEYFDLAKNVQKLIRKYNPAAEMPDIEAPEIDEAAEGTIATYSLPAEWALDARIAPSAGLSDRAAALAFAPETVKRLLKPQPAKLDTPLGANRPLAAMTHFDFGRLIDFVEPWIEYSIDNAGELPKIPNLTFLPGREVPVLADEDEKPAPFEPEQVKAQMRTFLSFLRCYKGSTSITYHEGKNLVIHSEWHYEDFPN